MSEQTIQNKSIEIRNETQKNANTKNRIADVLDDINQTKANKEDLAKVISGIAGPAKESNAPFNLKPYERYPVVEPISTSSEWYTFASAPEKLKFPITLDALKENSIFFDVENGVVSVFKSKKIGGNTEGVLIPFAPNIYFSNLLSISSKIVNAPINFIPIGSGAKLGNSSYVKLFADGINIPDFSRFKKLSGSQDYVNTDGVLNICYFYFDGVDAWVNIWQGIGTSNIDNSDLIAPTAPTLTSSNITSNSVDLAWSGATDDVGVTSFEVYKDNVLFDTVSASPLVVTGLTASTSYEFKVKAKDAAGNASVFSNTISATTTAPVESNVIFDSLSTATYNSGTNTLASSTQNTGGLNTTPISGHFEVYSTQLTSGSVMALKSSTTGGYKWSGGSENVQFLIACYYYGGLVYLCYNSNSITSDDSFSTSDTFIKLKRVGDNCQVLTSNDGVAWTLRYTKTGIFTGVSNLYIQGIFAVTQANSMSLKKL